VSTLRKRFASSLRFGASEQVAGRLFGLVTLFVLLRTLGVEEIAVFGVVTGICVLFDVLSIGPEGVTVRSYLAWEREGRARRALEALQCFAVFRLLLLVGAAGLLALGMGSHGTLLGYIAAYVAAVQLNNLAELGRKVFRVKLRQRTILWVDGSLRLAFLSSMFALFYSPSFKTYLMLFGGWAAVSAVVWNLLLGRETGARFRFDPAHLGFLKGCLASFSVWQHFNWIAVSAIFHIDPWIMSLLEVDPTTIGNYTIALKICNRLFLVAMFVQSMTTILLVNAPDRSSWPNLLSRVLGMNGLFALLQWAAFLVLGKLLVRLFVGDGPVDQIYQYAVLISTGVLVLNFSLPIVGYLIAAADMREVFLKTYLPVCLAALVLYPGMISLWGAWGAALASLASYSLLALAFAAFVRSQEVRLPMPRPDVRFLAELVRSW